MTAKDHEVLTKGRIGIMGQHKIIDHRMGIQNNRRCFKSHRKYDEGMMIVEDAEGKYILKVSIHETRLQNEAWLDIWYENSEVTQHVHSNACETFYIIEGQAELITAGGIRTVLEEGDVFHCPPGLGHEFHTVGTYMAWYSLFSNLHYWNIIQTDVDIGTHGSDNIEDVKYYRNFISSMNSKKLSPYPPMHKDETPHWVRRKGQSLLSYEVMGIKLNLKVAPWETNEVNEFWEMELKKNMIVTTAGPFNFWQTYIVTQGSMKCKVGTDEFVAIKDDVIQVHPHQPFHFDIVEDTVLLNWGSGYRLLEPLEKMVYLKREDPDIFKNPDFYKGFLQQYNLPIFIVK